MIWTFNKVHSKQVRSVGLHIFKQVFVICYGFCCNHLYCISHICLHLHYVRTAICLDSCVAYELQKPTAIYLHFRKIRKLHKMIQVYLTLKNLKKCLLLRYTSQFLQKQLHQLKIADKNAIRVIATITVKTILRICLFLVI